MDNEPLAVKDGVHVSVIVLFDLEDVLDPLGDLVSVRHYLSVDLLSLDVPAGYTPGLETFLNSGHVYADGSLSKRGDPLDGRVVQRVDRVERHVLLDEFALVVIQVYLVLVFRQIFYLLNSSSF